MMTLSISSVETVEVLLSLSIPSTYLWLVSLSLVAAFIYCENRANDLFVMSQPLLTHMISLSFLVYEKSISHVPYHFSSYCFTRCPPKLTTCFSSVSSHFNSIQSTILPSHLLICLLQLSLYSMNGAQVGFYAYFHLALNISAEITCFGDRVFYKDWWNAHDIEEYWRLWNVPAHAWIARHVYFPCLRRGFPKVVFSYAPSLI